MYISENCHWTPYDTNQELDKFVDSKNQFEREKAAKREYGL